MPAPGITAEQVLKMFRHDAPLLFMGAAFVAVGVVAGAFAAIRWKLDPLLTYFFLFAALYGTRLWIQSEVLGLTLREWPFYPRLAAGIN